MDTKLENAKAAPVPKHGGELDAFILPQSASLLEVLKTIDRTAAQIALSVNSEGKLDGLITDGDVRRALIGGASLSDSADKYIRRDFLSVSPETPRATVLDFMSAKSIKHIPVVDSDRCLCGIHLLQSLIRPQRLPNTAVILAGGQGTRLRPYTTNVPKPMLKVAGRPILERLLLHLVGSGIQRILLATNYLGHLIQEHFGDGSGFGCEITYLEEDRPLGTAGALSMIEAPQEVPLLVLNGDLVVQFDAAALIRHHEESKSCLTLGVKEYRHKVPYGCVCVEGSRVTRIEEKPDLARLVNAGIYVLSPEALERVPREQFFHMTDLISTLLESDRKVGYFEIFDDWLDVGQRENLVLAREGS